MPSGVDNAMRAVPFSILGSPALGDEELWMPQELMLFLG